MGKREYLKVNNPLIYIFIVFIIASYTYAVYSYNKLMATIVAVSFFIVLTFKRKPIYILVILMFFITVYLNNYWYYSYEPQKYEKIRVTKIYNGFGLAEVEGRIININIPSKKINIGERIYVKGEFEKDLNFTKGNIGEIKIKEYKKLDDDIITMLYKFRTRMYKMIAVKLGERKAALISAVSFGYTDNIDQDDRNEMELLGISHIIAVSGLHLAIVYTALRKFFKTPGALIATLVYVIFTGASASTVRAYIMVLVMEFGFVFRRNYNSLAALSLAGIIILLFRPYDIFNLGFSFSFLAVLGIVIFNKKINKKLYKLPECIRSTVAVTISAQILTIPLAIICFNKCSVNVVIGNLLAVPIFNIVIILGLVLIICYKIPLVFNFILYLCHYLIRIEDFLVSFIGRFSLEIIHLNKYISYFYIAMIITYYFYKKGYKRFIYYPLIVLTYVLISIYSIFPKVQYYKEYGVLISYKGERNLIIFNEEFDEREISNITLCNKIITNDFNKIVIGNKFMLINKYNNYLLKTYNNQYILKVNYGKIKGQYDIIDFIKGDIEEIQIYDDSIMRK